MTYQYRHQQQQHHGGGGDFDENLQYRYPAGMDDGGRVGTGIRGSHHMREIHHLPVDEGDEPPMTATGKI